MSTAENQVAGEQDKLVETLLHSSTSPEKIREFLPWIVDLSTQEQKDCIAEIQELARAASSSGDGLQLHYALMGWEDTAYASKHGLRPSGDEDALNSPIVVTRP